MKEEKRFANNGRPMLLFYLLVIYIFTSFIWWSYLLVEKNRIAFLSQMEVESMRLANEQNMPGSADHSFSEKHEELTKKYNHQNIMIISEGTVFLLLLAIGAYRIHRSFVRDMLLARQQNNFLLSITHELKSPLASIKLSLQTVLKRVSLEEKFAKILSNSLEDVDRLETLVDNILLAAKMEDSSYQYDMNAVDLSATITALLERLKIYYADHEIRYNIPDNINASIDRLTFTSVIINLVENAIKYSPIGTPVEVNMHREENEIIIEVKDQGIGIPDTEKSKIFGKFYRIGSEATRTSKGTGLGLYIVRRVLTDHGGRVQVLNNSPKGSAFRISLPAK